MDKRYRINPRLKMGVRAPDTLAAIGPGLAMELSISLLEILTHFSTPRSAKDVFESISVDIDFDHFRSIVEDLASHGLLVPEQLRPEPDLAEYLRPEILDGSLGPAIMDRRCVVIRDALPEAFARRVHAELLESRWSAAEGITPYGHYRKSVIDQLDGVKPALAECSRFFRSRSLGNLMSSLSGEDCGGDAEASAAWYRPYDYALPHSDYDNGMRSVAFLWYLSKEWRPEWGGSLFWCPSGQFICPPFNTLVVFKVDPENLHAVNTVSPVATERRLTINGFWSRAESRGDSPMKIDVPVSIPAYAGGHDRSAVLL